MITSFLRAGFACTCFVIAALGQPRIDALQNNYSFLDPGSPSYGIARGSIFIIYGANLANTSTGLQSSTEPPFLQTTLDGVSAQVTVNGVTTGVLWYYLTPGQLGGILPSATPAGNGTIVVNNNGAISPPAEILVVDSAFGVLTLNGAGSGTAAAFDVNYRFLSASNSAKPGDVIQLYGTGLGPVTAPENSQQPPVDLVHIPVRVEIAETPARVLFRGRIFPGLDQINVEIPSPAQNAAASITAFTQFGCSVPVNVQIGGFASNAVTIPISAAGGDCPPPPGTGGGGSTNDLSISQEEIDRWLASEQYRQGSIGLTRQTSYSITDDFLTGMPMTEIIRSDVLSAGFNRITGPDLPNLFNVSLPGVFAPEPGKCAVTVGIPPNPVPNLIYTALDAGPAVNTEGPNGAKSAVKQVQVNSIFYTAEIGTGTPGNFLDPGNYRVWGTGGPDVGAFSGTMNVAPELQWTNREALPVVDRAQPLTLMWSGGEPTTLVSVQATSFVMDNGMVHTVTATCWANNPDRQLTIPASVLQQLPASERITAGTFSFLQRGSLAVASVGTGVRMFADGVDYLTGGNQWGIAQSTEYK